MKQLLIILIAFSSTTTFAGVWVSEGDIALKNSGQRGANTYKTKGRCEQAESDVCHDAEGHDLRRESVQSIAVDDPSKPLFGPKLKSVTGLADLATCQGLMANHCDDQDPGYIVRPVCAVEGVGPSHELYCISRGPQSYEQMMADRLVPDAALVSADDAAKAAATKATADKAAAKSRAMGAANVDTMTLPELRVVVKDLIDSMK